MLKNFISELKRRNVFKVATAYAIAGWIIIQIVVAIKAPLSLPEWFDTAIIVLVIILLFGAKKIPELAKGLGKGIREFKDASKEIKDEIEDGIKEEKK